MTSEELVAQMLSENAAALAKADELTQESVAVLMLGAATRGFATGAKAALAVIESNAALAKANQRDA
jgi:hypothetical protein